MRWLIAHTLALAIPVWFDADKADGIDARIELRVAIRGRLAFLTLAIADRRCGVRVGRAPDSSAAAMIGLADLIRLVIGDVGWPQLLSNGRFQLSGDPFLALRLPTVFRLATTGRTGSLAPEGAVASPQ
jgi:hypothetical protein